MMDTEKRLADLHQLIDEFKRSGLRELQARHGDFEIYLSQDANAPGLGGGGGAPMAQVQRTPHAVPAPAAAAAPAPAAASAPVAQAVPAGAVVVEGTIDEVLYQGAVKRIELTTAHGRLIAAVPSHSGGKAGEGAKVRLAFARDALHLMDGP